MRFTPAILWGPRKDLDYWSALRAGLVDQSEQRAMALLRSLSDERRFLIYALTGKFIAMGNTTKHLYVLEHHGGVIEHDDMGPCGMWCIAAENRFLAPETDNVVTLKTLIEGEEMYFRRVGNRSPIRIDEGNPKGREARWPVVTPYEQQSFLQYGLFESIVVFMWLSPLTEGIVRDPEEVERMRNLVQRRSVGRGRRRRRFQGRYDYETWNAVNGRPADLLEHELRQAIERQWLRAAADVRPVYALT